MEKEKRKKFFKRLLGWILILVAILGGLYIVGYLFLYSNLTYNIIEILETGSILDIIPSICKVFVTILIVSSISSFILLIGRSLID